MKFTAEIIKSIKDICLIGLAFVIFCTALGAYENHHARVNKQEVHAEAVEKQNRKAEEKKIYNHYTPDNSSDGDDRSGLAEEYSNNC